MNREVFFKELGNRIKYYRLAQKMTIEELSKKCNIKKDYIRKIEKGKAYGLKATQFIKIAYSLNIRPNILVDKL